MKQDWSWCYWGTCPLDLRPAGDASGIPAVFFAGGNAAANVALGLVLIQNGLDLEIQRAVIQWKTLAEIFMHRALADAELLSGGPDSGPVLYDVDGQIAGPFLDISLQTDTLPIPSWFIYMRLFENPCHLGEAGREKNR